MLFAITLLANSNIVSFSSDSVYELELRKWINRVLNALEV
jgi:hypothetical protein